VSDLGSSVDVICLTEQPFHAIPLLMVLHICVLVYLCLSVCTRTRACVCAVLLAGIGASLPCITCILFGVTIYHTIKNSLIIVGL